MRLRITAITTAAVLLVLGVAGVGLITLFQREVVRRTDAGLQNAVAHVDQWASANTLPTKTTLNDLVQIVDDRGVLVYSSPSLEGEAALWGPGDPDRQPRTVGSTAHGDLRVIAFRFQDRWLVLAASLDPLQANMHTLLTAMLVGAIPLALVLGGLIWLAVGRTLRPVTEAVEREERLVADVSHELRTPLAGVRVLIETEPDDPHGRELNRLEILDTLARLETITDQLLILTRQDHAPELRATHPVDLDEIVLRQVHHLLPRSPVPIDTSRVIAGQVLGHEDDLESMSENLLTNAMRHASGSVRVSLDEVDGTVELIVEDDGPGLSPTDRERVFERFTRLDEARTRDAGGAGLGLSIVRSVVTAHHGSITVEDSSLGGASFVVHLPATTSGLPSPATPRLLQPEHSD